MTMSLLVFQFIVLKKILKRIVETVKTTTHYRNVARSK